MHDALPVASDGIQDERPKPSTLEGKAASNAIDRKHSSWETQYAVLHRKFHNRSLTSKLFAHCVFALICLLLGGAAVVFLLPQSFNPTGVGDPKVASEKIEAKLADFGKQSDQLLKPLTDNRTKLINISKNYYASGTGQSGQSITFERYDYATKSKIVEKLKTAQKGGGNIIVSFASITDSGGSEGRYIDAAKFDDFAMEIYKTDWETVTDEQISAVKSLNSHVDALKAVQGLVASQLQEQDVSGLIGQRISFFGNLAAESKANDWVSLIQPNITRFGTMIVVSFLVSILVPLYRYNIRLAAFYEARADALELLKTSLKSDGFISLSNSLTPTLDFGKQPQTPVEHIIEIAKVITKGDSKKKDGED